MLSKPVRLNMTNQLSVNFFIGIEATGEVGLIDRNLYIYRPGSKILSKCTNEPPCNIYSGEKIGQEPLPAVESSTIGF